MSTRLSRRNLLRLGLRDYARLWREIRNPNQPAAPTRYIRPPGALQDPRAFLSQCTRCARCSEACPHDAITPLGPLAGPAEGTPAMSPETQPCHWCKDMDCIQACPSGALAFRGDRTVAPIAKAQFHPERCLVSQGILCDTCAVHCPPHLNAIRFERHLPVIDSGACVGCGLCVYHCESLPKALSLAG